MGRLKRVRIALYPTDVVSDDARRASPVEPEASLRAELLAQISGAQATLEAQLDSLRHAASMGGDASALVLAEGQLTRLTGLGRRIEHSPNASLVSIRAEVAAFVAATMATAQQVRSAAATGHTAEMALHEAQAEARRVTGNFVHDFYERKIFDKYLDFASPEDERAYREREEAYRRAIEEERAKGTPEGQLRALELQRAQLLDAGAHGAADSPQYQSMLDENQAARDALASAVKATNPETQQQAVDALAPAEAALVSPELIAALRATGATLATSDREGHGVTLSNVRESGVAASV